MPLERKRAGRSDGRRPGPSRRRPNGLKLVDTGLALRPSCSRVLDCSVSHGVVSHWLPCPGTAAPRRLLPALLLSLRHLFSRKFAFAPDHLLVSQPPASARLRHRTQFRRTPHTPSPSIHFSLPGVRARTVGDVKPCTVSEPTASRNPSLAAFVLRPSSSSPKAAFFIKISQLAPSSPLLKQERCEYIRTYGPLLPPHPALTSLPSPRHISAPSRYSLPRWSRGHGSQQQRATSPLQSSFISTVSESRHSMLTTAVHQLQGMYHSSNLPRRWL